MYVVYILRCSDRSLYVGQTNNITRRLREHNAGRGAAYTFKRRPVTLAQDSASGRVTAELVYRYAREELERRVARAVQQCRKRHEQAASAEENASTA